MLPIFGSCLTENCSRPALLRTQIHPKDRQRLEIGAIYRIQRQG